MSQVMYVDCFSGAAGDMLLGALVDAGLPVDRLREALGTLGVEHELVVSRVLRAGVTATRIEVREKSPGASAPLAHAHPHAPGQHHDHHHGNDGHRSLAEIAHLIRQSALSPAGQARAIALFQRIGEVEAAIHGLSPEEIHLHEVGAVDSIIDIVGVVFALEWFGIDEIVVSPLNVGGGMVEIAHGRFPVPAPATAALLRGVPTYNGGPDMELVTPTGALLVSAYARSYGAQPPMAAERIGYGAGTRDFPRVPNVLRVMMGERVAPVSDVPDAETVLKLECEIDDMSPQLFEPARERLFAAGALDVFFTAVQMKKGRPGTLVTILAPEERRAGLCDVLFRETTTLGVRFERTRRETLERRWETVEVTGGRVRIKIAGRAGRTLNVAPEFDDCLRVAETSGRPVKEVQAEALRAWHAFPREPWPVSGLP
jgi:uncharacterized protein (TIGR00299 family) protein